MMMNRTMSALTASVLLATVLLATNASAQTPATPTATPGLRLVNHEDVAPWVGRAGQFPPLGMCPEGTSPLVLRTADHCWGPPSGYEAIVPYPADADSNACQNWYARESAAVAAPVKGWDGKWYIAGTQATVGTAAVYCVKQTDSGLVAVDIENRLKDLESRVGKLESAPPGASQDDLDALKAEQERQAEDLAGEANRIDAIAALQADQAEELLRLAAQKKPGRMHVGLLVGYAGEAGPVAFLTVTGTFLGDHLRLSGHLGINQGGDSGDEGIGLYGADAMIYARKGPIMLAVGATATQRMHFGDLLETPNLRHYGVASEVVYPVKKGPVELFGRVDVVRQTYDAKELAPLDKSVAVLPFVGVRLAL